MTVKPAYRYSVSGLHIASSLAFSDMPKLTDTTVAADIQFTLHVPRALEPGTAIAELPYTMPRGAECYQCWTTTDGHPWLSFAVQQDAYLLVFHGSCVFVVRDDCSRVDCFPLVQGIEDTIQHHFLDQVLPLLLQHRGSLVLHASSVRLATGVVGFLGRSTSGKSTIASYCVTQGARLITDDFLLLERDSDGFVAVPSYSQIRLWNDSAEALFAADIASFGSVAHYSDKRRVPLPDDLFELGEKPQRLKALFVLDSLEDQWGVGEPLVAVPISPQQALIETLRCGFVLDVVDSNIAAEHFARVSNLVRETSFYSLSVPRNYEALPTVYAAINAVVTRVSKGQR